MLFDGIVYIVYLFKCNRYYITTTGWPAILGKYHSQLEHSHGLGVIQLLSLTILCLTLMGVLKQQCEYSNLQVVRKKYTDVTSNNVFHIMYVNFILLYSTTSYDLSTYEKLYMSWNLTHWVRNKMATISLALSNAFSWMKIYDFR